MTVLVTGCGGFAGGHIARRLATAGYAVVALTRCTPVAPPADPAAAARFKVIHADLANPTAPLPSCDSIIHAAATSAWQGIRVEQMINDNVVATTRLVRHALDTDCKSFVFFSSLSAFGEITATIVDETLPSVAPDAYGATKLMAEQLLADVANELPSLSIRLPAVIGRGSQRNWLSEMLRKFREGSPLTYVNPDMPFNNAVHAMDLAILIEGLLRDGMKGADMVVVGAAGQLPVRSVVARLAARTDTTSEITVSDRKLRSFLIDCSKARTRYGFRPQEIGAMLERFAAENLQ